MKKTSLIETAARIATVAHQDQKRKDDDSPYIVHPFTVALKLMKYGFPDKVIAAALVHDVLEDTKVTEEELRKELGDEIVSMVLSLSEDKSLAWEERKKKYVENIRNAPEGVKAVSVGDKMHSVESFLSAHEFQGKEAWKYFSRGKDAQVWFMKEVLKMLKETWDHPLIEEFEILVKKLEALEN